MDLILKRFPGKRIKPESVDEHGTEMRDLLGVQLFYNRTRRWFKLCVTKQIDTLLDKFRMKGCRTYATPEVHLEDVESPQNLEFPL